MFTCVFDPERGWEPLIYSMMTSECGRGLLLAESGTFSKHPKVSGFSWSEKPESFTRLRLRHPPGRFPAPNIHALTCRHGGEHAGPLLVQDKSPVFIVASTHRTEFPSKCRTCERPRPQRGPALTPGAGGRPAASGGSAPASARWGRSAARRDLARAPRRCGAASRSAGARGGSDAPSRRTRTSALGGQKKKKKLFQL